MQAQVKRIKELINSKQKHPFSVEMVKKYIIYSG